MDLKDFIKPELLVLVPVLFFIGQGLKHSSFPDQWIPLTLGLTGIALASLYVFATCDCGDPKAIMTAVFAAVTQGILVAGASVYVHQLAKQAQQQGETAAEKAPADKENGQEKLDD